MIGSVLATVGFVAIAFQPIDSPIITDPTIPGSLPTVRQWGDVIGLIEFMEDSDNFHGDFEIPESFTDELRDMLENGQIRFQGREEMIRGLDIELGTYRRAYESIYLFDFLINRMDFLARAFRLPELSEETKKAFFASILYHEYIHRRQHVLISFWGLNVILSLLIDKYDLDNSVTYDNLSDIDKAEYEWIVFEIDAYNQQIDFLTAYSATLDPESDHYAQIMAIIGLLQSQLNQLLLQFEALIQRNQSLWTDLKLASVKAERNEIVTTAGRAFNAQGITL